MAGGFGALRRTGYALGTGLFLSSGYMRLCRVKMVVLRVFGWLVVVYDGFGWLWTRGCGCGFDLRTAEAKEAKFRRNCCL